MKRLPVLALLVAMTAAPLAHAAPSFTAEGLISYSNPASRITGGVTELVNPCGEPNADLREHNGGNVNGHDGWWIKLPSGVAGKKARVVYNHNNELGQPYNDATDLDLDAWFYNETCSLIRDADGNAYADMANMSMTTSGTGGPIEEGIIPPGAAWVIVDLVIGSDTIFKFEID